MRIALFTVVLLISGNTSAAEPAEHLMSVADITCATYLAAPDAATVREKYRYWVSGRIAAIVPATFQSTLAKIPMTQLQQDLQSFCEGSAPEITLFEASAIIAYGYQQDQQ